MRILVVGWGVVGQSFAQIIAQRKRELAKKYGFRPRIVAIVDKQGAAINPKGLDLEEMLALKKEKGTVAASNQYGHPGMKTLKVIESVEAEAMVEVSPTNIETAEPGLSYIKTAFKTGKHVVTTNKGPLALALPALTELADYNKVCLRFSGTVGAGTPILEFAKNCLQGDKSVQTSKAPVAHNPSASRLRGSRPVDGASVRPGRDLPGRRGPRPGGTGGNRQVDGGPALSTDIVGAGFP